ncbi:MAG: hypothetical protein KGL39_27600 [Patescibacteria group bacterium]|nr:hypothetical protein [Patescibacteria group bacterium]
MPFFLIIFGSMLIASGVNGKTSDLMDQLKKDGSGFLAFGAAVLVLGLLGTIETVRPVSKALLVLLFVAFLLKNGKNVVENSRSAVMDKTLTGSADVPAPAASTPLPSLSGPSNPMGNLMGSNSTNPLIDYLGAQP